MQSMRSFGRLLRRMRGVTPLSAIATKTGLDEKYLVSLEAGRRVASDIEARFILQKAFDLPKPVTTRMMLGITLYDLGLRDPILRQLVVDLITRETPPGVREQCKSLFRRYAKS